MAFSSKSLQENFLSMYKKSMLPFSFRKMEEETTEQRCAKQQLENLKWQQDVFHKILKMSGLQSEGIISEKELRAARSELLDTLTVSPEDGEWPAITRDKLLFLQELFYSKCISEEDYHLSKKPLLLRLAVQGAQIDSSDVLLSGHSIPYAPFTLSTEPDDALQALPEPLNKQVSEWSVVEFKEDQSMLKDVPAQKTDHHSKQKSPMKQIINAMSRLSLTPHKAKKSKDKHQYTTVPESLDLLSPKDSCSARNTYKLPMKEGYKGQDIYINPTESFSENPFWHVAGFIDAPEEAVKRTSEESSLLEQAGHKKGATKAKVKKAFNQLLLRANKDQPKESQIEASHLFHISGSDSDNEGQRLNPVKKTWGLDLFKSPKKTDSTGEMTHLPLIGKSSEESLPHSNLLVKPLGKGMKTNKNKKKKRSNGAATNSSIDKVLGENIKNELSRIRAEMGSTNPSPNFTNEQIEAVATRLPVDKNELTKFFPKSWCDRYGDVVLDVVKEEFKSHVGVMENMHRTDEKGFNNTARKEGLEDWDMNSPLISKSRRRAPKSMSSDTVNGCFNMEDENSEPNTSAFNCQQSKSPFSFHSPMSKPSSRSSKAPRPPAKSPPSLNHIDNRDSPSSPFFH